MPLKRDIFILSITWQWESVPTFREHTRSFFTTWLSYSPALPETTELASAPGQIHFFVACQFPRTCKFLAIEGEGKFCSWLKTGLITKGRIVSIVLLLLKKKKRTVCFLEQSQIFNSSFRIEGGGLFMLNCWGQTLRGDEKSWETNAKRVEIHAPCRTPCDPDSCL